jgi:hypothetical protein
MITRTIDKDAVIAYLQQDLYKNLNVIGHLNNNADSDIYIYNGCLENGVIISGEEQDFFFLSTYNPEFLSEFWEILPPGHKCFSGVPKPIAQIIQKDKEILWQNPCKVYVLKGEFEQVENTRYTVESLTLQDAEEVDKYYTYKSDDSINFIRRNIATLDSTCIRIDGRLASWSTVHTEDGSMGPLYTKEQYRSLGLASIVASGLIEKLIKKNIVPFVQIIESNYKSIRLTEKIKGMEYTHDCAWFGIEKNK